MAESSAIAWTKSTFNPWIGCTKVGPGCDGCYAAALDSRKRWGGVVHWGTGVPRHRTSPANWKQPLKWNKQAQKTGEFWPVFCASLADVFDNEVPEAWRNDLWALIRATPHLTWQLVTKRIGNVAKMLPADWGKGYPRVWIIATMVNQEEVDRDMPKLLGVPAVIHGVSYEPALEDVDWIPHMAIGLDWLIVGGESDQAGHATRHFSQQWAERAIGNGKIAGTAVFVKQMGSTFNLRDRAGADPAEWPQHLRVREFPNGLFLATA